jgi:predicted ArsR family transcriptional regulator
MDIIPLSSLPAGEVMPGKASARDRILDLLKRTGGLTAPEIARQLDVTTVAVRKHLSGLVEHGLVASRRRSGQRGRPAEIYVLSEAGEAHFPQGYNQLVVDLLQDLQELEGEQKLDRLFRQRNERLAHTYQLRLVGKPLPDAVRELARARDEDGYMAAVEERADGFVLAEHNCPIIDVAQRFPQACQCEQQLFERLLNTSLRRETSRAEGAPSCRYHIEAR